MKRVETDGGDGIVGSASGDGDPCPFSETIPEPGDVREVDDATGAVVWHRKHLRVDDQLAVARAVADADVVCPLFVFDPSFYSADGLACDARLRFLHEAVASLDRLYAAVPTPTATRADPEARTAQVESPAGGPDASESEGAEDRHQLAGSEAPGLTFGYGDPVTVLSRFVDAGWEVVTMATPTSQYGKRRDDRVRDACGAAVTFVSGDGLVRDRERSRRN